MDIVHIDPGYGAGLDGVTYVENETYNPINGVAFTKEGGGYVTLPVPSGVFTLSSASQTKVVTVRFSVYISNNAKIEAQFVGTSTYSMAISANGFHDVAFSRYAQIKSTAPTFVRRSIRDINGNITTADASSDNDQNSASARERYWFKAIRFYFPTTGACYVSNVIVTVGTEALSSGSFPVKLPLKNTSGDFISLGGGEYVGNSAGQKLLSTIDAKDVIQKFGSTSKVSHLVTCGNPGYRVGGNITSATGISESDSSIAAHGSCSLSTDTDASAAVAWAVDNTRLSDVDGLKIGWQV